ncbi:MAG: DUF2779 domain-containing protein [Mesotoga sp.]|uniref:DUF2779 domain-containing protein n=1 Tax=Mesotoga sp. TaxID=2053577 RepID=UPI0035660B0A
MRLITKKIFLEYDYCPVRGWIERNEPREFRPTIAEDFRMKEGLDVGRRARSLFPEGILIEELDPFEASFITERIVGDRESVTLFEPAFISGDFVSRADVVIKEGESLDVFEVKSSLAGSSNTKDYIRDLSYTVSVIESLGHRVNRACLIMVSRMYRKGDEDRKLFEIIDVTNEVSAQKSEIKAKLEPASVILTSTLIPSGSLGYKCRDCEHLRRCFGLERKLSIFELPRLGADKTDALIERGYFYLEELPREALGDKPLLQRVFRGAKEGRIVFDEPEELREKLNSFKYPIGYLDFETAASVIPLYDGLAPYEGIPYQYSLHIRREVSDVLEHREFLFDNPSRDESLLLAERLVEDLKDCRTLMAHHASVERNILRWLSNRYKDFPELSEQLISFSEIFVDSELLVKNHIYHPDFGGSFSIKRLLPALVKGVGYEGLFIHNGDDARYVFVNMALGNYRESEIEKIRRDMLEYCRMDTLAMVEIHGFLCDLSSE